jgi:hypothetical protein
VITRHAAVVLCEAIARAWNRWVGPPKFTLVDPRRSPISNVFVDNLGTQGATILAGATEASWTLGLVEKRGDYLREMVAKMELGGLPPDISTQCVIGRTTAAKNMMSRVRGCAPSQWVLATQPRVPESFMVDGDDVDHLPFRDVPESAEGEFAKTVRVKTRLDGHSLKWTPMLDREWP